MKNIMLMVLVLIALPGCLLAADAPSYKLGTITFEGYGEITGLQYYSRFFGHDAAVDRDFTSGAEAYDYSAHLIYDTATEQYRLYSGGRWLRPELGDGDHVLQHVSKLGEPGSFKMPYDRPEFLNGEEEGEKDVWYAHNCLEPEVLRVGDTYYMYTQVMIVPGQILPQGEVVAEVGADRIQLFTSKDGSNWERFKERDVVINVDNPARTFLHHQEALYVPWDPDGKPWWLYIGLNDQEGWKGYFRVKSADPKTFDWATREPAPGFAQLGNQLAYCKQAPGGPLFVRITFTTDPVVDRHVPSLQFSRDGLQWSHGAPGQVVLLAGSTNEDKNRNCYFLGLSTLDGTGELEYLGDDTYRALYVPTTSNTPVAMEIFLAEIGLGEVIFKLNTVKEEEVK